jgi:hypothetical protein
MEVVFEGKRLDQIGHRDLRRLVHVLEDHYRRAYPLSYAPGECRQAAMEVLWHLKATHQPPQSPQEPAERVAATATPPDASGASCGAVRGNLEGGT